MKLDQRRHGRRHLALAALATFIALSSGALSLPPGQAAADDSVASAPSPETAQAATDHFVVSASSPETAGNSFTVTVTAEDSTNTVVSGYTGTIHFVAADNQATVPADYTFLAADKGVHSFVDGVTLRTAGPDPITVTDTINNTITGDTTVTVDPAALDHFQVYGTSSTTPGAAFTVGAMAFDRYGNTIADYAGTVHFTSSDPAATLPANYTFTGSESGFHWWTNGAILRTTGTQRITVTDVNHNSVTGNSAPIPVYLACGQQPIRTVLSGQFGGRAPIGLQDELAFITNTGVCVADPGNGSFATPQLWSSVPFYGTRATLVGDVNGDGRADLIAVNDTSTWVMLSTGNGFQAPQEWSSQPFYGLKATLAAVVTSSNGTTPVSLIAVNDHSTWVMTSNGINGFNAPALWSTVPFFGSRGTFASDVTMTGKSALIAVDDTSVWIMPSTGSSFSSPAEWLSKPFYGSIATLATGDGSPELIAVNQNSQWVLTSTGSAFNQPVRASAIPFYGTQATLSGCVQGGTSVPDLIAVNGTSIWVEDSFGTAFGKPTLWANSAP